MSGEWVDSIQAILDDSLGTDTQKRPVMEAARQMDRAIPTNPRRWAGVFAAIRSHFEAWVRAQRYLLAPTPYTHNLPTTFVRSDAQVGSEYDITTKAAISRRQEMLAAARLERINRCAEHIDAWEDPEAAICFVCALDEWEAAKEKATKAV